MEIPQLPNDIILRIIREADGGRRTHSIKFKDSLKAIVECYDRREVALNDYWIYFDLPPPKASAASGVSDFDGVSLYTRSLRQVAALRAVGGNWTWQYTHQH
tara:strand:- start:1142 stop:1447 length:306 start_codon:yes stop_codon:yes gene_type:complete